MAHLRLPAWLALTLILSAMALLGASNRPALANWSGQNGKISYFEEQLGGDSLIGIATIDPDGTHHRLISSAADTNSIYKPASWSWDGTKLAAVSDSGGQIIVFDITSDFIFPQTVALGKYPSWIPDNQHLLASVDNDIVILDTNGAVIEKLTNTPNVDERDSALSPALDKIVFTSNENPGEDPSLPPVAGNYYNLWEMDSNGGNRHVLWETDSPNNQNFYPDWKPDASRIVFSDNGDLWTISPDGMNPTKLTQDVLIEQNPAWSPDGKLIAYSQGSASAQNAQIWTIDPDTKARTRITPNTSSELDFLPGWQPIGNRTAPNYHIWGSTTCKAQPTVADVLELLTYKAGITLTTPPNCPPMAQHGLASTNVEVDWGDVDCSGNIDARDVFFLLQYLPEIGPFAPGMIEENPDCPAVGSYLQWIALS